MALSHDFRQSYELFVNLTQRELRGKYKRTVLGQLWSLANPLALMLVYTVVFAFIIRVTIPSGSPSGLSIFPLWLLCGLLPWIFFSTVVTQGMGTLIANESLIRKVYFPRSILIFSTVASICVNWATEMLVLLAVLLIVGAFGVLWLIPMVIFSMVMLAIFATGIVLMLSIANVYFRDTQYLVGIALQLGMYLSPIVYPITLVQTQSDKIGPIIGPFTIVNIYELNPMVAFLEVFRTLLYDNAMPSVSNVIYIVLAALIALGLGWLVFVKNEKKLAEIL
ncbi:MAG: ABC transporter permease [Actinomycetales bacterium]|nr:ABC transporter permease [Actinomycetales bacterium]